jgi:hypothetical protein
METQARQPQRLALTGDPQLRVSGLDQHALGLNRAAQLFFSESS